MNWRSFRFEPQESLVRETTPESKADILQGTLVTMILKTLESLARCTATH
jgi:hypothetical protein